MKFQQQILGAQSSNTSNMDDPVILEDCTSDSDFDENQATDDMPTQPKKTSWSAVSINESRGNTAAPNQNSAGLEKSDTCDTSISFPPQPISVPNQTWEEAIAKCKEQKEAKCPKKMFYDTLRRSERFKGPSISS